MTKLSIGDRSENGQITIIDEDRLCYLVKSNSKGAVGLRTISKALLQEFVTYMEQHPEVPTNDIRFKISGQSDIDKYEYGYGATLVTMAKMILGQERILRSAKKTNRFIDFPLQRIFYGAPGTGKTYKMQHDFIDNFDTENCFVTTFHQSFSYEEFVEGLRPDIQEKTSEIKYKIEPGIFYKACERAAKIAGFYSLEDCIKADDRKQKMENAIENNAKVLLCIDEINRANVSAVFGDLISLIEPSKRIGADNEMVVKLPYSKKDFAVPANLMIIGTMNTADRSIQLLDSALRRRFSFEELQPDPDKIANDTAKRIFQAINSRIRCLLDKDHQIGHSYFMNTTTPLEIFNALKKHVIPLLEEYFYNDTQKIRQVLNEKDYDSNKNFYEIDKDAQDALKELELDYDDDKKIYKLNPDLSSVSDDETAKLFIDHIAKL